MQIAKLTPAATAALQKILSASSSVNTQKLLPLAVAYAVAAPLCVSMDASMTGREGFRLQHQHHVGHVLSQVNELIPFDLDAAMVAAMAFYCYRVQAIYPPKVPLIYNPETAIPAFFNITQHFSNEQLSLISLEPVVLCSLIMNVGEVISALSDVTDSPIPASSNIRLPQ